MLFSLRQIVRAACTVSLLFKHTSYIILLTLRAACRYQFSLVVVTFSVTLHKIFLSHVTRRKNCIVNRRLEFPQTHLDIGGIFSNFCC